MSFSSVFAQSISKDSLENLLKIEAQNNVKEGKERLGKEDFKKHFEEPISQSGVDQTEAYLIYSESYFSHREANLKTTPKKNPMEALLKSLNPNLGWIAALILGLFAIMRDTLKNYVGKFFTSIIEGVYNHLAGYKLFWRIALTRYRKALIEAHKELKIPFRPGKPLDMADVFVPLKVSGTSEKKQLNAIDALKEDDKFVVLGAPGSGKTMMMRNIALKYAMDGLQTYKDQPIPILLELHRLSDINKPILDQILDNLARHNFPNAKRFIKAGLKNGMLMFLFDGLDEVSKEAKGKVVQRIKDFMKDGPDCRAIISCRTAVYNEEFSDWTDKQLEIVEFDDQKIQSFLAAWEPEMPAGKSSESLIKNLQERPRILTLARNPLLLTIISYLYCDTTFILPHSRSEFYERATYLLLDQWDQAKGKRNTFTPAQKRLVLQSLALYFQERAKTKDKDRRSVPLDLVLEKVGEEIKKLHLSENSSQLILDEIVDRSGLLIKLDGGLRYQFSHLTLQEFFIAESLKGKEETLISNFEEDPNAWREVAKLWCGLAQDCSGFIKAIKEAHPITALECLGDAQQMDAEEADDLIYKYVKKIGIPSNSSEATEHALSMVASDTRPGGRGKNLLKTLTSMLENSKDDQEDTVLAITRILSKTNLPEAAAALAKASSKWAVVKQELFRLGNAIVPLLASYAKKGETWVLNSIFEIGTSQAALSFIPFLWSEKEDLLYGSAWRLGALLKNPQIESALNSYQLPEEFKNLPKLEWVWEPFDPKNETSMRAIAGRIAYLLEKTPSKSISQDGLMVDNRLAIPLCAINPPVRYIQSDTEEDTASLESTNMIWNSLFNGLPYNKQEKISSALRSSLKPQKSDWKNIFKEQGYYNFRESFEGKIIVFPIRALLIISAIILGIGCIGLIFSLIFASISFGWEIAQLIYFGISAYILIFLNSLLNQYDFELKGFTFLQYSVILMICIPSSIFFSSTNTPENLSDLYIYVISFNIILSMIIWLGIAGSSSKVEGIFDLRVIINLVIYFIFLFVDVFVLQAITENLQENELLGFFSLIFTHSIFFSIFMLFQSSKFSITEPKVFLLISDELTSLFDIRFSYFVKLIFYILIGSSLSLPIYTLTSSLIIISDQITNSYFILITFFLYLAIAILISSRAAKLKRSNNNPLKGILD